MHTIINPAEVERRLEQLIAKNKAKNISVAEIKRRIYKTDGEDVIRESNLFNKWWMNCFRRVDEDALGELLQAFQDAWNSFPHSALDGNSPQQMVQEEVKRHPELAKKDVSEREMPKIIVGDREMEWSEYETMLKRMEEAQVPFKRWIEDCALPGYRKFLQTKYKTKRAVEKHYDVADHFFKRALHVGFLDFEQIRPAFAVWEFPDWWPSHILYSNLNEDQVWSSLCDFLWFAEAVLHRSIPGIWEEAEGEEAEHDGRTCPHCGSGDTEPVKAGRNEPCPCGSGKKFKKCCGH